MKVLSIEGGFSAGDLCVDLCPSDNYSEILTGPTAVSYNLFVYGLLEGSNPSGEIALYGENEEWGEIPAGALFGYSFYMQSDESIRLKREKKKAEEENNPPGNEP